MKSAPQVENAIYNPLLLSSPAALGGVIVRDEPSYSEFAGCKRAKELLEEFLPSDLLYHGNLFPDYATQEQLYNRGTGNPALPGEGYEYARYIDDYIEIFRPRVLSYDYYPMVGEDGYIREGYFGNMSVIRNRAAEAEIPFWVYIQTCSFNASVRVPDEGEIGWLVNTSLAYGAKGIQYFTYFLPNDDGEVFRGAMVDREGNQDADLRLCAEGQRADRGGGRNSDVLVFRGSHRDGKHSLSGSGGRYRNCLYGADRDRGRTRAHRVFRPSRQSRILCGEQQHRGTRPRRFFSGGTKGILHRRRREKRV